MGKAGVYTQTSWPCDVCSVTLRHLVAASSSDGEQVGKRFFLTLLLWFSRRKGLACKLMAIPPLGSSQALFSGAQQNLEGK